MRTAAGTRGLARVDSVSRASDVLNYLRAEDPVYAEQMGMVFGPLYYQDHKVMNPVAILFDPILGEDVPSEQHLSDDTREKKRAQRVIQKLLNVPEVQSKLPFAASTGYHLQVHLAY